MSRRDELDEARELFGLEPETVETAGARRSLHPGVLAVILVVAIPLLALAIAALIGVVAPVAESIAELTRLLRES